VTTPYLVSEAGTAAVIPARGPCWKGDGEKPCSVGLDHKRRRKTGPPQGWVAVARCSSHRLAFTVYPAGHIPYGRAPLVVLAPDGSDVAGGVSSGAMAAATDAREGKLWPREEAVDAVQATQRRRILEAATLLGLAAGELDAAVAAAVLHLPTGRLVEVAQRLSEARDLVTWGREVSGLVEMLARRGGRWLMDRFAVLGHLAGRWGRPWRWASQGAARLLPLGMPFWRTGTASVKPP
jgi:hypothetical protein